MDKKCESCGASFRATQSHFRLCPNCFRSQRSGTQNRSSSPAKGNPIQTSLSNGYFDENGGIHQKLVNDVPSQLAEMLAAKNITTSKIRRFYQRAKDLERLLNAGEPYTSIVPKLLELRQHAANLVGRSQNRNEEEGLRLFQNFIDANVELAIKDEKSFRKGFLVHFQGLIAYFNMHSRGR